MFTIDQKFSKITIPKFKQNPGTHSHYSYNIYFHFILNTLLSPLQGLLQFFVDRKNVSKFAISKAIYISAFFCCCVLLFCFSFIYLLFFLCRSVLLQRYMSAQIYMVTGGLGTRDTRRRKPKNGVAHTHTHTKKVSMRDDVIALKWIQNIKRYTLLIIISQIYISNYMLYVCYVCDIRYIVQYKYVYMTK